MCYNFCMDEWANLRKYWPGRIVIEIASFEPDPEGMARLRAWAAEMHADQLMRECLERGETPVMDEGKPPVLR